MKKIILSMLAIALLSNCSKNENGVAEENPDALVPITLGSGVATATKSPIVSTTTFQAGIAAWESPTDPTYTGDATWNTNVSTTAVAPGGLAASVTWTDQKYYNAVATIKTYLKAWYPAGTLSAGAVTFVNNDGSVDAMLALPINGSKTDKDNKVLAFEHKTTQFTFTVKAGVGLDSDTKINSITIKDAELPTGFNLTTDIVNYASKADLIVSGIDGNKVIGSTVDVVGNAVMIKPNISTNEILLDVVTSNATYLNQKVTVTTANIAAGTHYVIALTFGQADIGLTATVKEWISSTGSGTIE